MIQPMLYVRATEDGDTVISFTDKDGKQIDVPSALIAEAHVMRELLYQFIHEDLSTQQLMREGEEILQRIRKGE